MDSTQSRTTLDSQLVAFWQREAARLDSLAAQARFGWQRRRLTRKAAHARQQAERSLSREMQRQRGAEPRLSQG